jgi:putative toxin-antitoxin system antitoxin component (TIGR02293 family)
MPQSALRKISPRTNTSPAPAIRRVSEGESGVSKKKAGQLFEIVARGSSLPTGRLRAEIIPDSSWKRAGATLSPSASQSALRLEHALELAESIWGEKEGAISWLNAPHPELAGATPYSLLRTEAGGRAVEALLIALDHGFPV